MRNCLNIRQDLHFAVEQLALTWEGKQHRALQMLKNTNILLKVYGERDINKRYKRHGELELVKTEKLTEKAKKMRKWVFKRTKRKYRTPF